MKNKKQDQIIMGPIFFSPKLFYLLNALLLKGSSIFPVSQAEPY